MEKSFFSRLHGAMLANTGTEDVLQTAYGLPSDRAYDAVIVAPAWVPEKLLKHTPAKITPVVEMSVCRTYEIELEGRLLAWVQTGTGAGNVIDIALSLAGSAAKQVIFVGSVGALDPEIRIGEIATPSHSVAGDGASLYLYETIDPANFFRRVPQGKQSLDALQRAARAAGVEVRARPVYCVDAVTCEYHHMPQIRSFGCELIEMETAAFMRCMELSGKKYAVLLCVSDNSAAGAHLVGRSEEDRLRYWEARERHIPRLILELTKQTDK